MADAEEGKIYTADEVLNLSDSEMYFRFCSAESIPSKTSHYRSVKYKCYCFPTIATHEITKCGFTSEGKQASRVMKRHMASHKTYLRRKAPFSSLLKFKELVGVKRPTRTTRNERKLVSSSTIVQPHPSPLPAETSSSPHMSTGSTSQQLSYQPPPVHPITAIQPIESPPTLPPVQPASPTPTLPAPDEDPVPVHILRNFVDMPEEEPAPVHNLLDNMPVPYYESVDLVKHWDIFTSNGDLFIPSLCVKAHKLKTEQTEGKCVITRFGRRHFLRSFYDIGPITTSVQRYKCFTCDCTFTSTDSEIVAQYPEVFNVSFPIIRYGKVLLDRVLFDSMYKLHRITYNANAVLEAVHAQWHNHYMLRKEEYIRQVQSHIMVSSSALESISYKPFHSYPEKRLRGLQRKFWKRLLLDFHANLKDETMSKLDVLAKFQSKRLSIDHTFRVVKNVVAIVPASSFSSLQTSPLEEEPMETENSSTNEDVNDIIDPDYADEAKEDEDEDTDVADGDLDEIEDSGDDDDDDVDECDDECDDENEGLISTTGRVKKEQCRTIHLSYAEVFVINENGMVVGFEHCKSKSFDDLKSSLERIWSVQSPTISTNVTWTDNVHADTALLKACYNQYRPEAVMLVGQDSFHVCDQRIVRETSRKHPDHGLFRRVVKSGFRKFHEGDGWRNKEEFKDWMKRIMQDFQYSMSGNVTDEELIQLALIAEGGMCGCPACSSLQQFLSNPESLVLLLPCSRIERLHVHRALAHRHHLNVERYKENVSAMLVKKLDSHPHAVQMGEQFATCLGQQLVNATSQEVNFVPMSDEPGIVTDRVHDVMGNQLNDDVVNGLWVHYAAKQWGLLGTTVNERFHKFANAKLKGIRIISWELFELYLLWLIEDWNCLHPQEKWVTPLPAGLENPFKPQQEKDLDDLEKSFDSMFTDERPSRNKRAFLLIKQTTVLAKTVDNLLREGVPINLRKYKWTAEDKLKLKQSLHLLVNNTEQPPRPPGKSHVTWLKEEVFSGFGPTEDQIRKMIINLRFS